MYWEQQIKELDARLATIKAELATLTSQEESRHPLMPSETPMTSAQTADEAVRKICRKIVDMPTVTGICQCPQCQEERVKAVEDVYVILRPIARWSDDGLMSIETSKSLTSEFNYQDKKFGNQMERTSDHWLIVIGHLIDNAISAAYKGDKLGIQEEMRCIAACALRCLNQHGAPMREEVKQDEQPKIT